jgi:hypothetical protein
VIVALAIAPYSRYAQVAADICETLVDLYRHSNYNAGIIAHAINEIYRLRFEVERLRDKLPDKPELVEWD